MFRKVLVAIDFSRHAEQTLECIGEIPGMESILLVHAVNGVLSPAGSPVLSASPLHETAQSTLEAKKRYLESTTGVPVRASLVESIDGNTAGPIAKMAKEENVSLVVMGGHGRGLIHGLLSTSVTEEVIRRGFTDVLAMYFRGMEHSGPEEKFCRNVFNHVLCPVDFSRPSETALEYLGRMNSVGRVTLLHVIDREEKIKDTPEAIVAAEQRLSDAAAILSSLGIRTQSRVAVGDPVPEILRVAREDDVSLIMISRFGKSDYMKNIPLGRVAAGVLKSADRPVFVTSPHISLFVVAREMTHKEYSLAESVWQGYHRQKADPDADRVFGTFVEGKLAALAKCKRHPDGLEVDGVFVPEEYRGRGYARKAVQALVDACGNETLFMHSTGELMEFYSGFGFVPITETELPRSIRDRFNFAEGDMASVHVQPMRRDPGK